MFPPAAVLRHFCVILTRGNIPRRSASRLVEVVQLSHVGAGKPSGYWLAHLPVKLSLKRLVGISKHRWVIERDYEELKQELGLGHYERPRSDHRWNS